MKLTDYTDYTLRTLIYLGLHRDELVTIQQIADSYDISKNQLMKIVNRLAQDGIVKAVRGRSGGVRLALDPAEIGIGEVVRAAERVELPRLPARVGLRAEFGPPARTALPERRAVDPVGAAPAPSRRRPRRGGTSRGASAAGSTSTSHRASRCPAARSTRSAPAT